LLERESESERREKGERKERKRREKGERKERERREKGENVAVTAINEY
jgi:hypothetical protein